jgi:hypothetical protein
MTPESREAIATIREVLDSCNRAAMTNTLDAYVALDAIEETLVGEAEIRRQQIAYIGELRERLRGWGINVD